MRNGFTLIELSIGVAILGAIAYIAVPNIDCLYKTAEDSEAKAELSAAMAAEKMHFAQYDTYTACLKQIGYRPRPDRLFSIGFSNKAVVEGQPKCGKPTDPKYYVHQSVGNTRKDGPLPCNTWGNKATNVCVAGDPPINSPDSTSDINFAANKAAANSIPISYANQSTLQTPCKKSVQYSLDGRPWWIGCWGAIGNASVEITAIRGRTFEGKTNLSGFWIQSNGAIISFEAAKGENH